MGRRRRSLASGLVESWTWFDASIMLSEAGQCGPSFHPVPEGRGKRRGRKREGEGEGEGWSVETPLIGGEHTGKFGLMLSPLPHLPPPSLPLMIRSPRVDNALK